MNPSSPSGDSSQSSPAIPPRTSLSYRPGSDRQVQSPESTSPGMTDGPIPDDNHGADLPMNMTASIMLTGLPRDAHQALADVEAIDAGKGTPHPADAQTRIQGLWTQMQDFTVRFQPLPSAPILKTRVFKVSASQKFETVVKFLRKKLDCKDTDSVFCYVNSVFAPGLDEGVGGLWRCFKTDDQLIVAYSMTPAFG
ncbi:Ubiquitin-like protein ATG12 [Penicillium malachiteum]|uniref:Ubiquitin-like protein ATG12 n=1 Tax=Penicillium malachiteum TaxID=1324776 RepID=UPI0025467F87|nr:Ubiquitin-like protein ATG12 [Penicillium malachiteum]KAJ5720429.1 Ubiquitin-like protein ATG12 [Penicillium malachiteum]